MTPKETLDTLLGFLGFAVQVEEQPNENGMVLQVYTSDAEMLIGRNGEMLGDIQHLLNRLTYAADPSIPRVVVDVEHYKAMQDDKLIQKVRQIGELVKECGRAMQTEPMNGHERWLIHQAYKDDPDITTWSPDDHARLKRITLRLRKKDA